MFEQAKATV
uniref:Uncharacterized protein n=1 Tax=Anguilla anguilla TaxID=7936 RepID=A0A0E9SU37_ANGAN